MKKMSVGILIAVLIATGVVLAKKGDKNATGHITTGNSAMSVVAKGNVESGYLWLGFTFIHKAGWEEDKEVVKVRRRFKKLYTVGMGAITEGKMDYVASLWRWKVDKDECTRGPCEYCKRNGYHMEDRVDTSSGTWSP